MVVVVVRSRLMRIVLWWLVWLCVVLMIVGRVSVNVVVGSVLLWVVLMLKSRML